MLFDCEWRASVPLVLAGNLWEGFPARVYGVHQAMPPSA